MPWASPLSSLAAPAKRKRKLPPVNPGPTERRLVEAKVGCLRIDLIALNVNCPTSFDRLRQTDKSLRIPQVSTLSSFLALGYLRSLEPGARIADTVNEPCKTAFQSKRFPRMPVRRSAASPTPAGTCFKQISLERGTRYRQVLLCKLGLRN